MGLALPTRATAVRAKPMTSNTGKKKFQKRLVFTPSKGSSPVSSSASMGWLLGRSTCPESWARRSAFAIGPQSGKTPRAISATSSTAIQA